ncbi:MAG: cytochrome d ubiquinol oxidase subunit II [Methylovirgula sp.]
MLEYETLRVVWWVLLGLLLIGFAVMDGFDLGAAILMPFVGETDDERRIVVNALGPVWEGNQVWLILGGGAIFAAWPYLYAVAFSGFYLAMFLVLAALILRPVAIVYRSKVQHALWRSIWDWAFFVSGIVPALIFGVALGNALLGVPFRFDDTMRMTYDGNLFGLLNPFSLLCGLTSVAMLTMQGSAFLAAKADAPVGERAARIGRVAAAATIVLFALGGIWLALGVNGYAITSAFTPDGPSDPLLKTVAIEHGAWLKNYAVHPEFLAAPILGFVGALLAIPMLAMRRDGLAFLASSISTAGIVATVGASMFPFLLPSSLEPKAGLTIWDASSSQLTLMIMLVVTCIFLPIIIAYTAFVYRVMRGRVMQSYVTENSKTAY